MHKIISRHLAVIAVLAVVFIPGSGHQAIAAQYSTDQTSPEKMIVDLVIARPIGIAVTAIGTVFFIASLPFSALGGNTKEAARELVGFPAYFTFQRPLGHF